MWIDITSFVVERRLVKMNIKELLEQYAFHDSLVEDMSFENNRLEFQIYLWNWKQTTYEKQEDEMKNIRLIFKDIRNLIFDVTEEKFDCDSIVDFSYEEIIHLNEVCYKVKLFLDGDTNMKIIEFIGKEVEVIL